MTVPNITITSRDSNRLLRLVETSMEEPRLRRVAEFLDEELARAEVIPPEAVKPTLVTMNSRVEYEDLMTGQRRSIVLVYPEDADADAGRLSVLSPVGAALLGLSEGQEITWRLADGLPRRLKILNVVFQPEATGQYDR